MEDPKSSNPVFTLFDLDTIKDLAIHEYNSHSLPFQFKGERPMTHEEYRMYCISFATMQWMHGRGLVVPGKTVEFQTERPDSDPETEYHDWVEHDPDAAKS